MTRSVYALFGLVLVVVALGGMYFMSGLDSDGGSSEVRLDGVTGAVGYALDFGDIGADIVQASVKITCQDTLFCSAPTPNKICSYVPPNNQDPINRKKCCPQVGDCVRGSGDSAVCERKGAIHPDSRGYICGDYNDWDVCGAAKDSIHNKGPGEFSDDGQKVCQGAEWVARPVDGQQAGAAPAGAVAADAGVQQNAVLTCDVDGADQPVGWVSGDKTQLCAVPQAGDDADLLTCDESSQGEHYGSYACDEAKWVACSRNTMVLTTDKSLVCANGAWSACSEFNEMIAPPANGFSFCNGGKWQICDDSHEGLIFGDDVAQCHNNLWSTSFSLSNDGVYELSFVKNVAGKTISVVGAPAGFQNKLTNLCDTDSAQLGTHATMCVGGADVRTTVPSVQTLAQGQLKPVKLGTDADPKAIWFFSEGAVKKVSLVLVKKFENNAFALNLGSFSQNMAQGRKLGIILDGEYYVISHPVSDQVSPQNIVAHHVPTMHPFTVRAVGSGWYQFDVLGGKSIAFRIDAINRRVQFQSMSAGERLQAYPVPYNLQQQLEVVFDADAPVTLLDRDNTVVTVCNQDNARDVQIMQTCLSGRPQLSLQKDVLVNLENILALYQYVDIPAVEGVAAHSVKRGYLFRPFVITAATSSADTGLELSYNPFIDAVVTGHRVGVVFNGKPYLIEHTGDVFSLRNLKLVSYLDGSKVEVAGIGNEQLVTFKLVDGEVYLRRPISFDTPPPFILWGKTNDQLGSVDLDAQFSTSMNSLASVPITLPNFGIVARDQSDVVRNSGSFKIKLPAVQRGKILDLRMGIPQTEGSAVFYYNDVTRSGENYVKTVRVNRFFDVTADDIDLKRRVFDDAFLDVFTSGHDLALKFEDSFYLLGYEGEEGGFFSIDNMVLKSLDGSQSYPGVSNAEEQSRSFVVSEGEIVVTVDDSARTITFSSKTQADLVRQDVAGLESDEIFAVELLEDNSALVGQDTYRVCDNADTSRLENSVRICKNGGNFVLLAKNQPSIEYLDGYLVNYKGRNADGKKVVTFQNIHVFTFDSELPYPSFAKTGSRVTEGKARAYKWGDQYFELTADDPALLSSYSLRLIPSGEMFRISNVLTNEQELSNGTIVFGEKLLYLNQSFDEDFNIMLNLRAEPFALVSNKGVNISRGQAAVRDGSVPFGYVARVGGSPFKVLPGDNPARSALLRVNVTSLGVPAVPYFYSRLANDSITTVLLPTGESIQIHVMNSTDGKIEVR